MADFGVIVECSRPEIKDSENLSCSGVYLGNGFILSHGTIIVDILKNKFGKTLLQEIIKKGFVHYEKDTTLMNETFKSTCSDFRVIFPVQTRSKTEKLQIPLKSITEDQKLLYSSATSADNKYETQNNIINGALEEIGNSNTSNHRMANPGYSSHPASVVMVFTQDGITESLSTIMPSSQGWKLTEDKDENLTIQLERILLSAFVLLRISNKESELKPTSIKELIYMIKMILSRTSSVHKGSSVLVESSPFGSLSPGVFINSLSFGIISNVCGKNDDVLLTDARCIMGSEGAPVFADDEKSLCGLVISPFCWRQGEWLGLTLVASAQAVLTSLVCNLKTDLDDGQESIIFTEYPETLNQNDNMLHGLSNSISKMGNEDRVASQKKCEKLLKKGLNEGLAEKLDKSVVTIQCGSGWGSGVIVSTSPGVILTCAHVINPATNGVVKIVLSDGQHLSGQVVFKTKPASSKGEDTNGHGRSVWDLAVIETSSLLPSSLPLASEIPPKGWPVVVAGHGVFSPRCLPKPSLSRGIVSKTIGFPTHAIHLGKHSRDQDLMAINKVSDNNSSIGDLTKPIHSEEYCRKASTSPFPTYQKYEKMIPLMLQTTCAVYAGTSGGPIVSPHPKYGFQIVGIVVCNTQDTANKATFPHINLAIPAAALKRGVEEYIETKDKNVLRHLDFESNAASQLWALGVIPKSNL